MKIKSIKKIDYKEDVYNLHIKDNHNYFANNHCVSNCHDFDDVMSDFISIKITETIVKRMKFSNEREIIKKIKGINTIDDYVQFLSFLNGEILDTCEQMEKGMGSAPRSAKVDKRDLKISKVISEKNSDVKLMNQITDLKQYQLNIEVRCGDILHLSNNKFQ